jgi:hypothetical protein
VLVVLCLGLLAIVGTAAYPPWSVTLKHPVRGVLLRPAGYAWLTAPPSFPVHSEIEGDGVYGVGYGVDYPRLLVTWLIVAAGTGAAVVLVLLVRRSGG